MGRRPDTLLGNRRAIREALSRLGMHASPADVVRELIARQVWVSEELVRAVRIEMLKDADRLSGHRTAPARGVTPARHRPQKKPPRRG